ncbi:hypothetical protein RRG08_042535 [Elysia crispata]|uniref:Uncharacterized protein n=1 Tax=Elysia crispata TaxID=231223 RepID=A0AAE0XPZ1_9GAST|nr:hypothetical protein RRG08_042535 [Elysia crispata]
MQTWQLPLLSRKTREGQKGDLNLTDSWEKIKKGWGGKGERGQERIIGKANSPRPAQREILTLLSYIR